MYDNQGTTILELSGRLDMAGSVELENKLEGVCSAGDARVILDMAEVSYVNSTGIRVLVRFFRMMQQSNRELVLAGMTHNVQRAMHLVGLQGVFNPYATLQAALASATIMSYRRYGENGARAHDRSNAYQPCR
jgi:anti-sigma B factor antagonist